MAVRRPVKWNGSGFVDLTSAEMTAIQNEIIRLHATDVPQVLLVTPNSILNLNAMYDTREIAGTGVTGTSSAPTEAETPDVTTTQVTWQKISRQYESVLNPTYDGYSYPLYRTSGGLQAMSETDMYDTFIDPVLTILTGTDNGYQTAGTYTISTDQYGAGGFSLATMGKVFEDTKANVALYTSDGLFETQDQPTTVTSYWLHRYPRANEAAFSRYIGYELGSTDAKYIPKTSMQTQLQRLIRYHASQEIDYQISTTTPTGGTARGSAILDTRNTSSEYLTRLVSEDDYRAQEVPRGPTTTINTYRLYIIRA